MAAARTERQHYDSTLKALKSQLVAETEPDWQKLLNEDPIEYVKQNAIHQARRERLAAVESEQRRVAELNAADQQRALQGHLVEEERRLNSAIPEWTDAKRAKADKDEIAEYARSLGFSDAELSGIYDHRAVIALREAALYRKMVAAAKKKVESVKDGPKTSRPGNMQVSTVDKGLAAARDRFGKTGNVKDAGAVLNRLLAPKPKGI